MHPAFLHVPQIHVLNVYSFTYICTRLHACLLCMTVCLLALLNGLTCPTCSLCLGVDLMGFSFDCVSSALV